jgi:hypothetical protein
MARTFLPKLTGGIGTSQTYAPTFIDGDEDLLRQVYENMEIGAASTEARAPSPFARIWQFQRSLEGRMGVEERRRAVSAFRGIVALFALRGYYHFQLQVDVTSGLIAHPNSSNGAPRIPELFEIHTGCLPESRSPQPAEARFLFGRRIIVFNLLEPGHEPPSVIAGYSPLTLIVPAARSIENSQALSAAFWYDRQGKRWLDPTEQSDRLQGRLPQEAREQIATWLDMVLSHKRADGEGLAILEQDRLPNSADTLVTGLLQNWRREIRPTSDLRGGSTSIATLPRSEVLLQVEHSEGTNFAVPRLLETVYSAGRNTLPTDFHSAAGIIYVTLEESKNPHQRIYGNVFGSPEIHERLQHPLTPAEGSNLGTALDRSGEAPVSYVIVDKLFTGKLGRVQNGLNTVAPEWAALSVQEQAAQLNGIYLLPFDSAVLRYFTPEELREETFAYNNIGAVQVALRARGKRAEVRHTYTIEHITVVDPSLDLRFFPKYRLDSVADLDRQLPMESDRLYHARVRLSPELEQLPLRWLERNGSPIDGVLWPQGDYAPGTNNFAEGRQFFWTLPATTVPSAFQIEGFGLLLLNLFDLNHHAQVPSTWRVGLDFGTTNSSVAVDRGAGNVQTAEKLPVFVTTFLQSFATQLRGGSDEGRSALADFFFWQNPTTAFLNDIEYFPTQILTRHALTTDRLPYGGFDLRNGLAFFPNVSLATIDNPGLTDLIFGFGSLGGTQVKPRFNLNRELKWRAQDGTDRAQIWRGVFHRHLRLQLVLTAAYNKACISHLIASYPKAFLPEEVSEYRELLRKVWGDRTDIELRSESAAAAVTLEISRGHEYFLIDMGGGTTDIAVFKNQSIEEECSVELAGGILEEFVVRSAPFRAVLARTVEIPGELSKAFVAEGGDPGFYKTCFHGLLAKHGTSALARARNVGAKDKATQAFFLSAILLYSGFAFFCGRWLKQRRKNTAGTAPEEHLQWLGNGSTFIRLLSAGEMTFQDVLARIFNEAAGASAKPQPLRDDAKTIVVKGLLGEKARIASATSEKVFGLMLSDSLQAGDRRLPETETLAAFYQEFEADNSITWHGLEEGRVFRSFLETVQRALDGGVFNKAKLLDVGLLGAKDRANWAVQIAVAHGENIAKKVVNLRLKDNKARWGGVLQSPDTLYVEPLFISELAALLVQIRETFAEAH